MDASFGPEHRLHDGRDYSRVFNRQQKAAGRHVVVLVRPRSPKESPEGRVGVMIAVKTAKLAVRRHQLKRWVRELFRHELKGVAAGHDVVVLFRSDPPADAHPLIAQEIRHLLPKAIQGPAQPGSRPGGPRTHGSRPTPTKR
jgi:ribonuclease P protein component